ncbi:MAG: glycosyltransferase WbuB [Acidobacteria bacterium]|nr:MAG: glycosyltransferase WbuB [Acidobacteriota bacterium]
MAKDRRMGVLMIVENLPVPFVRRAWQECCALRDAGCRVSVISPKGPGCEASYERIEDIDVYRHRVFEAAGTLGYFLEYGWAMAAWLWLSLKAYARRPFKILHAWNPPDLIFLVAWFYRLFGVRFIFDHLDLSPELYLAKFSRKDFFYRLVCLAERLSFKTAAVSLATNQSFREIAIERGGKSPDRVFIVRVSPVPQKMRRAGTFPELKEGKPLLVVYLGVMGPQDGVDIFIEAVEYLVKTKRRTDTQFALIGGGTEQPRLKQMANEKGLGPAVKFTGRLPFEDVARYLSTADVGAAPDPLNDMNDRSTMGKILEYMCYEIPVVLFELTEGRRSADNSALYAKPNDPVDFAEKINQLLDSESLRRELGARGRRRIEEVFNWEIDRAQLLRAYEVALSSRD